MFNRLLAAVGVLLSVLGVLAFEERELAAPRDVHFFSVNLRNMVRWSSGTANISGTSYTVEYAIYGDAAVDAKGTEQVVWRPVEQCDDITQTECDVTQQTSDIEEEYYVRVRANGPKGRSEWTETEGRLRVTNTILGPPQVNVLVVKNMLHINLTGPFRWRKPGKKHQSMFNIFPHMVYNISVYNNRSKHTNYFLQPANPLERTHGPLEYNSEYCVKAEVLSQALHLTNTPSDWICVSTPDDPFKFQMLMLILGGIVPTAICLFVLATVGGFAYYYICGHKPRLPRSVDIQEDIHTDKFQIFQPEKHLPSINLIVINNNNLSLGESKFSFPGLFKQDVDTQELSRLTVMENILQAPDSNQNIQPTSPSPPAAAAAADPQICSISLSEDYGVVCRDDGNKDTGCPYNRQNVPQFGGGVSLYMKKTEMAEPSQEVYEEEIEEEEESQTFCNWGSDFSALQLNFPLLSRFNLLTSETTETPMKEDAMLPCHPDLTSVLVKQASNDSTDDDPLLRMEKDWNLQIQTCSE